MGANGTRFTLGQTVMTAAVGHWLQEREQSPFTLMQYLSRHATGDWGDVCAEDRRANEQALIDGSRIFSVYKLDEQTTLWVITEADRSSTCILFPNDY